MMSGFRSLRGVVALPRRAVLARLTLQAVLALLAMATTVAGPGVARAQGKYPDRPIRLLVGYSAGGGVDAAARLLAAQLSRDLGQQVIVENRTGASGLIAAEGVAKSVPDGYSLMLGDSALLAAKLLRPNSSFDPLTSFRPVAGAYVAPLMIVAANDFPASTPAELVTVLKAKTGGYSYATSGIGTVHHLGMEMLKQASASEIVHVPYRGASQIIPDIIGGQIPLGVVSAAAGLAQTQAGKLKAVALMNAQPLAGSETVLPMATAIPGFDVAPRLFLLAPVGTPDAIVERLSAAVKTAVSQPDAVRSATGLGMLEAYADAKTLGELLAAENEAWKGVIARAGIVVSDN